MTPTPTHQDPLAAVQRSTRAWVSTSVVALAAVAVWACWPTGRPPLALEEMPNSPVQPATAPKLAFNTDAFNAPLWTPSPPPQAAPVVAQKPAPPPMKLQLVGITRDTPAEGGAPVLRAALYDPDSDKLLIVAAGETITTKGPSYTVARLTGDAIDLSDGETTRTLSLKDEKRPGT